jgi:catechol 2,3-dioxygenase-like lactoylglutathione lyase family enzyme
MIFPKDFQKSKDFYHNELGFEITNEWDRGEQDKGTMFQVGNTTLELLSPKDDYQPIAGVSVALEVEDVQGLWKNWAGKPNVIFPLRDNEWSDTSFCISDPEGLELIFFTKR